MKNEKLKIKSDCVRLQRTLLNNVPQAHSHFTFYILHFALLMALLCFAQPALAMGSAPKKEEPKYKVEILKMEVVSQPATKEVSKTKKSGLKK
jgi:hypothetical protein